MSVKFSRIAGVKHRVRRQATCGMPHRQSVVSHWPSFHPQLTVSDPDRVTVPGFPKDGYEAESARRNYTCHRRLHQLPLADR